MIDKKENEDYYPVVEEDEEVVVHNIKIETIERILSVAHENLDEIIFRKVKDILIVNIILCKDKVKRITLENFFRRERYVINDDVKVKIDIILKVKETIGL